MPFKLNNKPYAIDNTPIYNVDLEDGVLGKADRNGSILINKNVDNPKQIQEVIDHETEHIIQMRDGRLDYDKENVYWEGKTIPRSSIEEGAKNLPWEKEVYNKTKK